MRQGAGDSPVAKGAALTPGTSGIPVLFRLLKQGN